MLVYLEKLNNNFTGGAPPHQIPPIRRPPASTEIGHLPAQIHISMARRRSKGFLILLVKLLIFLIFAVYGIWEDLGAWKILLRDMPMICLQFWEFSKMTQNREVSTFFSAAEFCPKQYKLCYLPAKSPPSKGWPNILEL